MSHDKSNPAATRKAISLVELDQYVIGRNRRNGNDARPSPNDESECPETYEWAEYAQWFVPIVIKESKQRSVIGESGNAAALRRKVDAAR